MRIGDAGRQLSPGDRLHLPGFDLAGLDFPVDQAADLHLVLSGHALLRRGEVGARLVRVIVDHPRDHRGGHAAVCLEQHGLLHLSRKPFALRLRLQHSRHLVLVVGDLFRVVVVERRTLHGRLDLAALDIVVVPLALVEFIAAQITGQRLPPTHDQLVVAGALAFGLQRLANLGLLLLELAQGLVGDVEGGASLLGVDARFWVEERGLLPLLELLISRHQRGSVGLLHLTHRELLSGLADLRQTTLKAGIVRPLTANSRGAQAALLDLRAVNRWNARHQLIPPNDPKALPMPPRIEPVAALLALLCAMRPFIKSFCAPTR